MFTRMGRRALKGSYVCCISIACLESFALFQRLKSKNMFLKPHIFSALGKAVQGSLFSCQRLGGLDDLMI